MSMHCELMPTRAGILGVREAMFAKPFAKIGDGLGKANDAFNKAAASFQTRVRPAGERLAELGGSAPGKDPPEVPPLDAPLRLSTDG